MFSGLFFEFDFFLLYASCVLCLYRYRSIDSLIDRLIWRYVDSYRYMDLIYNRCRYILHVFVYISGPARCRWSSPLFCFSGWSVYSPCSRPCPPCTALPCYTPSSSLGWWVGVHIPLKDLCVLCHEEQGVMAGIMRLYVLHSMTHCL